MALFQFLTSLLMAWIGDRSPENNGLDGREGICKGFVVEICSLGYF